MARKEARIEEAMKTVKFKEELRGDANRAYHKGGGFLGQISKNLELIEPKKKGKKDDYDPLKELDKVMGGKK